MWEAHTHTERDTAVGAPSYRAVDIAVGDEAHVAVVRVLAVLLQHLTNSAHEQQRGHKRDKGNREAHHTQNVALKDGTALVAAAVATV